MAETNTEKSTAKEDKPSEKQKEAQNTGQSKKQSQKQVQKQTQQKTSEKKTNSEEKQAQEQKTEENKTKEKTEDKKQASEEKKKKQSKPKKSEAKVNVSNMPLSTKVSAAICKFIKNKEIKKAVEELNQVIEKKKPIPMKGEYPHQKGIMSGKYPVKAAKEFRTLLRSLGANAVENGLEKPIVKVAIANKGQRPMAKFGMWERKRTHITLIAKEGSYSNKSNKKKNK